MKYSEIWFKAQRVLRTIVQVVLAFLSAWAVIAIIAPQILTELATILPGSWIAWLTGVIAFVTVVAGVLTRIMAIPQVNAWLTKLGLGSAPKSASQTGEIPAEVQAAVMSAVNARDGDSDELTD
ncbi:hypothetical protein [Microbacterium sp. KR10-403]|uniref:hypothetical protein n=1 Tax=Microbacterium sp. KR10-403 TaxID=3158581 RepID=UPI0032E3D8B5